MGDLADFSFELVFICRCGNIEQLSLASDRSTSLSNGAIMLPSQLN